MTRATFVGSIALLAIAVATSAAAAPGPIAVKAGKTYRHAPSGVKLGAVAAGLPRVSVTSVEANDLTTIADYRSPDGADTLTVFVFRNVTGDVGPWMDRAQRTIEMSDRLGRPTLAIGATPFALPGVRGGLGLKAAYSVAGAGYASTAVGLAGGGDWYVKARATSKARSPADLAALIEAGFAAIDWPRGASISAAVPVVPCAPPLAKTADAKLAAADASSLILRSVLGMAASTSGKKVPVGQWCREPLNIQGGDVYRPDRSTERYLLAVNDAGWGATVGLDGMAGLMAAAGKPASPRYSVSMQTSDREMGLGAFESLPTPRQVAGLVAAGKAEYVVPTWGKSKTISISPEAMGN